MSQGIPEQAEIPPAARVPASGQATNPPATNLPAQAPQPAVPTGGTGGPNANPLDLFPQVNCFDSSFKSSGWGSNDEFCFLIEFRAFPIWVQMLVQATWISSATVNRYIDFSIWV